MKNKLISRRMSIITVLLILLACFVISYFVVKSTGSDSGQLEAGSGHVQLEYNNATAAMGQDSYIDDVRIVGSGSARDSYINMGYLPYYRTNCYKTLNYNALTHLCLAFFNPDSSLEITDKFSSDTEIKSIISKAHENGVEVLASYGGASGKSAYKDILESSSKRSQVVNNMIAHALKYDFDGIDVDIEASESDTYIWDYYESFISELRTACDKNGLLLTTATADWYADAITTSTLEKFDIVGVMAYDDGGSNHSTYEMAVDMVEYFVDRGVSKSKIVMGVPFYGYLEETEREGAMSYKEIVDNDSGAYSKDYSNGMAYNGIATIQKKCSYVKNNGYGGIMIWELGQDTTSQDTSLLNAIMLSLYGDNGVR